MFLTVDLWDESENNYRTTTYAGALRKSIRRRDCWVNGKYRCDLTKIIPHEAIATGVRLWRKLSVLHLRCRNFIERLIFVFKCWDAKGTKTEGYHSVVSAVRKVDMHLI